MTNVAIKICQNHFKKIRHLMTISLRSLIRQRIWVFWLWKCVWSNWLRLYSVATWFEIKKKINLTYWGWYALTCRVSNDVLEKQAKWKIFYSFTNFRNRLIKSANSAQSNFIWRFHDLVDIYLNENETFVDWCLSNINHKR